MLIKYYVTWFGSGLISFAPGTMGSAAALPVVWLCYYFKVMPLLGVLALIAFLTGVWASDRYLKTTGKDGDPKEIVIDEVAGQWLTFAALPVMYTPICFASLSVVLVAGFLAFRFFDIVKPWPASWVDRNMKNAWGIMLDDIVAGAMAAVTLCIVGYVLMLIG